MPANSFDSKVEKLRGELRTELHNFMNAMELRFVNFASKFEKEQTEHHHENKKTLTSIERTGQETSQTTTILETRMDLLFDAKGKGLFYDLQQEVKKLVQRVTYVGGIAVGAYILFNLLHSLGLIK